MTKDEKLTEEEALKRAKKEGIEFVDKYSVVKISEALTLPTEFYDTKAEAEKELKKKGKDYTLVQTRSQK